MKERRQLILNTIIKEHILSGCPVGSSVLVDKYNLNISPATVRNEMAALEEEDYITQPHTSAGRIPTEKAYRLYLKNLHEKDYVGKEAETLQGLIVSKKEENFKEAAKEISKLTGNACFWAFNKNSIYYTGISNLFKQPEFKEYDLICDISAVIDRIDEIINEVFSDIKMGKSTMLGSSNPFGIFLSTIFIKYKLNEDIGLVGILGPLRMDYERNISIASLIEKKIK